MTLFLDYFRIQRILILLTFLGIAASKSHAAAPYLPIDGGDQFIANWDFSAGSSSDAGQPTAWVAGDEGRISLEKDIDGRDFVRLTAEAPNQLVMITQMVAIPEDVDGIVFHARFRNENVKFGKNFLCDARARFRFYNAEGEPTSDKLRDVIFDSHAQEWRQIEREYLVPEGAVAIKTVLCLNRPASGILDIEAVQFVPMAPDKAEAMALAPKLAKLKAEADAKEVEAMKNSAPITRPIGVYGNRLITPDRNTVRLQGVNVVSLEWSHKGEQIHRSLKVALRDWQANAIRLPVNHSFWFGRGKGKVTSNDAEAYRQLVDEAIAMVAGEGAYLILDLHSYGAPQEYAREFWLSAAERYANHPAVLFDLFNEPHGIDWELWRNGGEKTYKDKKTGEAKTIQVVGMQALVEAVRSTGAKNVIIAGGLSYALKLEGVLEGYALEEPGGYGIMYATHFYNWHRGWQKHFLDVAEKYPVLVGEFGADVKKMSFFPGNKQESPYTWVPDALAMVQKYQLNWTAFSFHPKATPVLIKDWSYTPTDFWGKYVKAALGGETFELKKMR